MLISVTKGFVSGQVNPAWTAMTLKEPSDLFTVEQTKGKLWGFKVKLTSIHSTTSKSVEKPKIARCTYRAISVGGIGLEPTTFAMSTQRSNQLS